MILPEKLSRKIKERSSKLNEARITLGFDGFVDTVVKVVKSKSKETTSYFNTISEFGEFTRDKGGMNFSLEMEERFTKAGGNAPIMGQAMAHLGAAVHLIGALGYPHLHPVFEAFSGEMKCSSFARPGLSTALEFHDGKILLAQTDDLNKSDWATVKEKVGMNVLQNQFNNSDLIALLNWGELDHATTMWIGILREILHDHRPAGKPIGFFDLSDCSRREPGAILEALKLLTSFGAYWSVTLSMNKNEAQVLHQAINGNPGSDLAETGHTLYQYLKTDHLIIHHAGEGLGWNHLGMYRVPTDRIAHPVIATGAGDNFNAGLAAGLIMKLTLEECIQLGHGVAATYMNSGKSPGMNDILQDVG